MLTQSSGQDRRFDVSAILVAIADQQGIRVFGEREGDQKFSLAPRLQSEIPAIAAVHKMLHHMSLLVALDREDALIRTVVGVVGNGALKGSVETFQPIFEDVIETDEQRGAEVACLQTLQQLHQVQRSPTVSTRLNHDMSFGVD